MLTLCAFVLPTLITTPTLPVMQEGDNSQEPIAASTIPTGLYGWQAGSPLVDLNGDGVLDFIDVSIFIQCYNTGAPCADINGDGIVNFFDISLFLQLCDS